MVAWSDTDPPVEMVVADSRVLTWVGQLTVMVVSGLVVLPPSLAEVTVAWLDTVPQVAVVVEEVISTVGLSVAVAVGGRLVPVQVRVPAVVTPTSQLKVDAAPLEGVGTIDQLVPALVGRRSVTVKLVAVPGPPLETFRV